jgi:F420-dependent oxidoreductase-like protein
MNIGISGGAATSDRIVGQVEEAEADGFTSIWFPGAVNGDPLLAMARAAKATSTIELGTSVLQTYPCHPVAMAGRVAAAVNEAGRALTIGVGPSHDVGVEGAYGIPYDRPGLHTEDYVSILGPLLRGEPVDHRGEEVAGTSGRVEMVAPAPLLVGALAPRLLRVAGELTDGTITWMADAEAIRSHVAPRIAAAAESAGRPAPRIVVGIPISVHDDEAEARDVAAKQFAVYGQLPNYRRILDHGNATGPAEIALVGNEDTVAAGIKEIFDAGATDVWAAPFNVGENRRASRSRTRDLLRTLAQSS